jgi:DNA-binding NtrC family response regulator
MGHGGRRRVLVGDDDALLRWAIAARVSELGYEAIEAGGVREILERDLAADVAFIDLRLPDGDGLAAARELIRRRPERRVVLMSAFATPEIRTEAERTGVHCCLDKPIDFDSFARLLGELLRD